MDCSRKKIVDYINSGNVYYSSFQYSDFLYRDQEYGYNELKELYNFVLSSYNALTNRELQGLIFAFLGSDNYKLIQISDYYAFHKSISDSFYAVETFWNEMRKKDCVILELEYDVTELIAFLPIDINDFQFLMPRPQDMFPYNVEEDVPRLLKNLSDNQWYPSKFPSYLVQAHLPYISKDNLVNVYPIF